MVALVNGSGTKIMQNKKVWSLVNVDDFGGWRRNCNDQARLVIPVFRNLFFGPPKAFLTGFLRILFLPANSGGIFHRNVVLEGVAVIPVFFLRFYRIFSQDFLGDRNSCIYSGFLRNPE